jgi:hypothetical protein
VGGGGGGGGKELPRFLFDVLVSPPWPAVQTSVPGRDALSVLPTLEDLCTVLANARAPTAPTPVSASASVQAPTEWPAEGALARKMVAAKDPTPK